ncbi:hypothetical protein SLI_1955 [Streptomyces lividans 1326]|uniref:Uncharacterized protein n=1 Tax=Streptomyces lividans 1326 TaxID=1200984 RepID=A0A7U9DQN4_STRLI|nr:hypothetical protein SLI_1955 [Streptomyces lividans 1326]
MVEFPDPPGTPPRRRRVDGHRTTATEQPDTRPHGNRNAYPPRRSPAL